MPNRTAKFVSAIFAGVLAGANFAAVSDLRAQAAADNCLTAPKGATPAGSHWYYRIDHANKRNCWYLRGENDKSERAVPQDSSQDSSSAAATSASATPAAPAAANPAPPPQGAKSRKSIADARAEWTSQQMRIEQDASTNAEPRIVGAAPAASLQNSPRATVPDAVAPSSPLATRWPDSSGVSPSADPRVAEADPPASPQPDVQPTLQPAAAPVALAAADAPLQKQSASMQMLFLVMAGALTLAGITASVIFRFGRARARRREIRNRRMNWDSVRTERSPRMIPGEDVPMWRRAAPADTSHDPRAADDPERRVTELLERLARSAQT